MVDSSTLNSLSSLELSGGDYTLVVINNGPKEIIHESGNLFSSFKNVFFECFLENLPLSKLYNYLIKKYNDFDRFIFFDDDTSVPHDFFSSLDELYEFGIDMQLPKIISSYDQVAYYPLVNGEVDSSIFRNYLPGDEVYSIGSGMVIYKSLLDKLSTCNELPFDERFALYGVDMSIFRIMRKVYFDNDLSFQLQLASEINHSLSRVSDVDNTFRKRERIYDSVLSSLNYPQSLFKTFKIMIKSLWYCFSNVDVICFSNLVKIFFSKKHPRC